MNLITPHEAQLQMLAESTVLGTEIVPLEESLGRVLREDLFADRPFPPFDRVTMDGIAFRHKELQEAPFILQGIHAAGSPTPPALKKSHCWQIMTGSVMPPDCDTIVPYEEVTLSEETASVNGEALAGQFIHREGSDAQEGDLILSKDTLIEPGHIGMMASLGADQVKVSLVPKVVILTTGDELVPITECPLPHQLRQSNGITLLSAVQKWGPAEVSWTHLPDDLDATTKGIATALETADLLLLSGGISKGRKDYVRPALESLRGKPTFHGVAQRPGKPLAFWPSVVALPGNPNSTLTTFQRYVVPLLNAMVSLPSPQPITLPLSQPQKRHPFLTQLLPMKLNPSGKALILSPQNSGDFVTPLTGTHWIEISAGEDEANEGIIF